eukprot:11737111-Alexandrium_andersonii.AAC.1
MLRRRPSGAGTRRCRARCICALLIGRFFGGFGYEVRVVRRRRLASRIPHSPKILASFMLAASSLEMHCAAEYCSHARFDGRLANDCAVGVEGAACRHSERRAILRP